MSIHPGDDELLDHALFGDSDVAAHLAQCGDCRARAATFAAEQKLLKDAHAMVPAPAKLRLRPRAGDSAWKWTAIAAMALLGLVSAAGAYAYGETRRLGEELASARERIATLQTRAPVATESAQLVSLRDSFRNVTRSAQESQWDPNPRQALEQMELEGAVGYMIADLTSRMELTNAQSDRLRRGLVVIFRDFSREFDPEAYERRYRELLSGTLTPEQMKVVVQMETEQAQEMRAMEIEFLVEELAQGVALPDATRGRMQALFEERLPHRKMAIIDVDGGAMDALLDDAKLAGEVRTLLSKEQALKFDGYLEAMRRMREEFKEED